MVKLSTTFSFSVCLEHKRKKESDRTTSKVRKVVDAIILRRLHKEGSLQSG